LFFHTSKGLWSFNHKNFADTNLSILQSCPTTLILARLNPIYVNNELIIGYEKLIFCNNEISTRLNLSGVNLYI